MKSRREFLQTSVVGGGALLLGGVPLITARAQDTSSTRAADSAAAASAPALSQDAFGFNLHLDRFDEAPRDKQLAQVKAMSVRWVRGVSAAWYYVEHKPGARDFGRPDSQLASIQRAGMKTVGGLGYAPIWASRHDPNQKKIPWGLGKYPPDDMDAWASFVHDTVAHYRGRIDVWSPWNEPDSRHFFYPEPPAGFTGDEAAFLNLRRQSYLDLQRVGYEAAKRANPDCTFLSAAFASGGTRTDQGFVKWLIEHGMMDFCDALDLHTYWSCANLRKIVTDARTWMAAADKVKPVWMTEFGAGLREDKTWIGEFTHDQIQSFVPKALATARSLDIARLFWYQGYTDGSGVTTLAKSNYALNVTDGPTPAAWSFAAAAPLFGAAKYVGLAELVVEEGRATGHIFDRDGTPIAIAWAVHPDNLDNRSAAARATLKWNGRELPLHLSERPTILAL